MINRLSLKASSLSDSIELSKIQVQLREQELLLSAISKKFSDYPAYQQLKFASTTSTIAELQEKIIPANGILLSYHIGDSSLLCWIITKNNYEYQVLPYSDTITKHIEALQSNLRTFEGISPATVGMHARILYKQLIEPFEEKIKPFDQLMIIPDDEISFIPFEVLMDKSGEYLVNKIAISYNYSCSLFRQSTPANKKRDYTVLAYAPYSMPISKSVLPVLPESKKEIEGLTGKLYSDSSATKESFIKSAANYSVIHLATHAKTNDQDPFQSYIAFYPAHPDSPALDKMYLPEIYTLSLPNTSRVILSACETGAGQLIKGEGVISLSRAFSYAGCPNIITSQWKADDHSTAYITRRLHTYISGGNSMARALQQAKLDYLNDPSIEGRFKTPAYWAHLHFIGQFDQKNSRSFYWILLLIPLSLVIHYTVKKAGSWKSRHSVS